MERAISNTPPGYRWMVSPDGYQANLVREIEAQHLGPDWADCSDMSDPEVMKLMERRMLAAKRNEQLPMAA